MVAHFKKVVGRTATYEITRENVEFFLGDRIPWFQKGVLRKDDRHFAVCPYCNNPIQLKGLYKSKEGSPRPYGSHTGTPIKGFYFNLEDLKFCPYRLKKRSYSKNARRPIGATTKEIINTVISEFDRIVLILREDFGFPFSDAFAQRMLSQWFDSKGYLYMGAHLRNIPWMIAYFSAAENLFKQYVDKNTELVKSIKKAIPQACISDSGQLDKGSAWYALSLQCLRHKTEINPQNGTLIESLMLRIQDFTNTNFPEEAPLIYKKTIIFNPDRFGALMHTPPEKAKRNANLLNIARQIAEERKLL